MPPEERFVPRFAAEPPQEELPYGRWEERLRQPSSSAAAARIDAAPEDLGEPGEISGTRTAPGTGARTCPGTSLTSGGYELFGYVRFVPAPRTTTSRATSPRRSTSPTRPPSATPTGELDLCDEVIGSWRGQLRRRRRDDARVGPAARSPAGAIVTAELADLAVDQCELIDERFTLIAPDDYRHDLLEIKLFDGKGRELARESLYAGEDDEEEEEEPEEGAATP